MMMTLVGYWISHRRSMSSGSYKHKHCSQSVIRLETLSIDCNTMVSPCRHGLSQPTEWVLWTLVLVCLEHIELDHPLRDITYKLSQLVCPLNNILSIVLNPEWIMNSSTLMSSSLWYIYMWVLKVSAIPLYVGCLMLCPWEHSYPRVRSPLSLLEQEIEMSP